jgi:multicomponent Na+:H+ antiporter subunit C
MYLPDPGLTLYAGAIGLVVIGIAGLVISKNLYRILLALVIAEAGANMLLVLAGFRPDAVAPILTAATNGIMPMVDPVPQAMVLTSIVIGVGVQALALSLIMQVYRAYGTLDMRVLATKLENDIAHAADVEPASSQDEPVGERPLPAPVGEYCRQGRDA